MSALVLCVLCYWATKSGACGFANELAFAPGKQVGKYSRKVKKTLGFDRDECRLSPMFVPGHSNYDLSRSPQRIWVRPPHEIVHEDVTNNTSLKSRVEDAIAGGDWAPSYLQHPVVVRNPGCTVVPLGLYFDGAPFQKHDGFLAFIIINLITLERSMTVLLRKSSMCQCGCMGLVHHFRCDAFPELIVCMPCHSALLWSRQWHISPGSLGPPRVG